MRELKFRIWNKNAKVFVGGPNGHVAIFDLITFAYFASANRLENLDDFVIQQFTGLFDKNNVLIYEGDVLTDSYLEDDEERLFSEVIFEKGSFKLKPPYFLTMADEVKEMLVVGNIFTNPELLK